MFTIVSRKSNSCWTVVTYESVGTLARQVYSYACKVTPTCMNSQSSDDNMAGVPVQGEGVGEA